MARQRMAEGWEQLPSSDPRSVDYAEAQRQKAARAASPVALGPRYATGATSAGLTYNRPAQEDAQPKEQSVYARLGIATPAQFTQFHDTIRGAVASGEDPWTAVHRNGMSPEYYANTVSTPRNPFTGQPYNGADDMGLMRSAIDTFAGGMSKDALADRRLYGLDGAPGTGDEGTRRGASGRVGAGGAYGNPLFVQGKQDVPWLSTLSKEQQAHFNMAKGIAMKQSAADALLPPIAPAKPGEKPIPNEGENLPDSITEPYGMTGVNARTFLDRLSALENLKLSGTDMPAAPQVKGNKGGLFTLDNGETRPISAMVPWGKNSQKADIYITPESALRQLWARLDGAVKSNASAAQLQAIHERANQLRGLLPSNVDAEKFYPFSWKAPAIPRNAESSAKPAPTNVAAQQAALVPNQTPSAVGQAVRGTLSDLAAPLKFIMENTAGAQRNEQNKQPASSFLKPDILKAGWGEMTRRMDEPINRVAGGFGYGLGKLSASLEDKVRVAEDAIGRAMAQYGSNPKPLAPRQAEGVMGRTLNLEASPTPSPTPLPMRNFASVQEAERSGLARGTVVLVQGRRYQI